MYVYYFSVFSFRFFFFDFSIFWVCSSFIFFYNYLVKYLKKMRICVYHDFRKTVSRTLCTRQWKLKICFVWQFETFWMLYISVSLELRNIHKYIKTDFFENLKKFLDFFAWNVTVRDICYKRTGMFLVQ